MHHRSTPWLKSCQLPTCRQRGCEVRSLLAVTANHRRCRDVPGCDATAHDSWARRVEATLPLPRVPRDPYRRYPALAIRGTGPSSRATPAGVEGTAHSRSVSSSGISASVPRSPTYLTKQVSSNSGNALRVVAHSESAVLGQQRDLRERRRRELLDWLWLLPADCRIPYHMLAILCHSIRTMQQHATDSNDRGLDHYAVVVLEIRQEIQWLARAELVARECRWPEEPDVPEAPHGLLSHGNRARSRTPQQHVDELRSRSGSNQCHASEQLRPSLRECDG